MGNIYSVVDTIYKIYISNKDSWFWWLFFPSVLARGLEGFAKAQHESGKSNALIHLFEIYNRLWWISKWLFPIINHLNQPQEFSVYQLIKSHGLDTNILNLYLKSHMTHNQFIEFLRILKNRNYLNNNIINRLLLLKAPLENAVIMNLMMETQVFDETLFEKLSHANLTENQLNLIGTLCKKRKFSLEVFEQVCLYPLSKHQLVFINLFIDSKYFDNLLLETFCQLPETQLLEWLPLIEKLERHQCLNIFNPINIQDQEIHQSLKRLDEHNILSQDNILLVCARIDRVTLIKCFSYLLQNGCYNQITRQAVIDETELENLLWLMDLGTFKVNEQFLKRSDKSKVYSLLKTLVAGKSNPGDENFLSYPQPEILNALLNRFDALNLVDETIFSILIKHPSLENISIIFDFLSNNTVLFKDSHAKICLKQILEFSYSEVFVNLLKHGVLTRENSGYLVKKIIFHKDPSYLLVLSKQSTIDAKLIEYLISHPKYSELKSCCESLQNISISQKNFVHLVNMVNEGRPIEIFLELLYKNKLMRSIQGYENLDAIISHRFLLLGNLLNEFWEKIIDCKFSQNHLDKIFELCDSKLMLSKKIEGIARFFLIEIMQLNQADVDKKSFLSPELFLVESKSSEIAFHYYQYFYPKSRDYSKIDDLLKKIKTLDCPEIKRRNAFNAIAQYSTDFYDPISNVNLMSLIVMIHEVIQQFSEPQTYLQELVDSLELLFFMQPEFEKMFDHLSMLLNSFYEKQYSMKMNLLYLKDEVIGLIRENTELFIKLFPDAQNISVSILPVWESIKTKLYPNTQGLLEPCQVDHLAKQIKISPEEVRYKTLFISQIKMIEPITENFQTLGFF